MTVFPGRWMGCHPSGYMKSTRRVSASIADRAAPPSGSKARRPVRPRGTNIASRGIGGVPPLSGLNRDEHRWTALPRGGPCSRRPGHVVKPDVPRLPFGSIPTRYEIAASTSARRKRRSNSRGRHDQKRRTRFASSIATPASSAGSPPSSSCEAPSVSRTAVMSVRRLAPRRLRFHHGHAEPLVLARTEQVSLPGRWRAARHRHATRRTCCRTVAASVRGAGSIAILTAAARPLCSGARADRVPAMSSTASTRVGSLVGTSVHREQVHDATVADALSQAPRRHALHPRHWNGGTTAVGSCADRRARLKADPQPSFVLSAARAGFLPVPATLRLSLGCCAAKKPRRDVLVLTRSPHGPTEDLFTARPFAAVVVVIVATVTRELVERPDRAALVRSRPVFAEADFVVARDHRDHAVDVLFRSLVLNDGSLADENYVPGCVSPCVVVSIVFAFVTTLA